MLWLLLALPCALAVVCEDGGCENVAMLQKRTLHELKEDTEHTEPSQCDHHRCGRGHSAWGAGKLISTLESARGDFGIDVKVDGRVKKLYLPGAKIEASSEVEYGVNDKFYLMKENSTDYADPSKFEMIKLAGKTMVVDINLNGANCGCNVNFFLVKMPAGPPGQSNDHYCDANCVDGNCCAEFDLCEMNDHALQITNHNCHGTPSKGSCDANGDPMMRFGPPEYGPGDKHTIDTTKPFKYMLQVEEVKFGDSSPDNHLIVHCRLFQNGRMVHKQFGGKGSPLNSQWGNLADGMVLVVDYWQSPDLHWLDGAGCGGGPESCSYNKAQISAIKFISNDLEKSSHCPGRGSCNCDFFDGQTMADDDGSECWCRCGGCHASSMVPRCQWSGYEPVLGKHDGGGTVKSKAKKLKQLKEKPSKPRQEQSGRGPVHKGSSSEPFVKCQGDSFLDCWTFFTEADPTHGDVVYVSAEEATNLGLYKRNGSAVLLKSLVGQRAPAKSIRLHSKQRFSAGNIFVIDVAHMPTGMGVWPAWWTCGENWPANGEIDIIETVNIQKSTQSTLHTSDGCVMDVPGILHADCHSGGANDGCGLFAPDGSSGPQFNAHGGGAFATAWTEEGIRIWFWPRDEIPENLAENKPDTTLWGKPYVNFPFGDNCPSSHFKEHQLIINLAFCGDWAGNVFPGGINACNGFIQDPNNIPKLADAYWKINYVKVFPSATASKSPSLLSPPSPLRNHSGANSTTARGGHPKAAECKDLINAMGRGINIGNTYELEQGDRTPAEVEKHVDWVKRQGFQNVRVPVTWGENFDAESDLTKNVTQVVDWAIHAGLYVIINAHHEHWLKDNYDGQEWQNSKFWKLWHDIASHFQSRDGHLIFEILNEPEHSFGSYDNEGGRWPNPLDETALQRTREINGVGYDAVRNVSKDRFVFVSPNGMANIGTASAVYPNLASLPGDGHDECVGVEVHSYDPWGFAGDTGKNSFYGTIPKMKGGLYDVFRELHKWQFGTNIPVYVGEFGVGRRECCQDQRNTELVREYYKFVMNYFRLNGWAAAAWDDPGWFVIYGKPQKLGAVAKPGIASALTTSY